MNARLIKELRMALCLTEEQASDAEILEVSEGTLFRAMIEFRIAVQDVWDSLLSALGVKRLIQGEHSGNADQSTSGATKGGRPRG